MKCVISKVVNLNTRYFKIRKTVNAIEIGLSKFPDLFNSCQKPICYGFSLGKRLYFNFKHKLSEPRPELTIIYIEGFISRGQFCVQIIVSGTFFNNFV